MRSSTCAGLVGLTLLAAVTGLGCYPSCTCIPGAMRCTSGKLLHFPHVYPRGVALLDLSGNDIEYIPRFLPVGLRGLVSLNLSRNRISGLEERGLEGLPSLASLDLSRNSIRGLWGWSRLPASLESLDLSGNPLREIPGGEGRLSGPGLRALDLRGCRLSRLNGADSLLSLPSLTGLRLTGNPIGDLEPPLRSHSLASLHLDSTGLRWLKGGALEGLSSLVNLDLSDNPGLTTLATLASPSLKHLAASSCSLDVIQFGDLPSLEDVDLSNNELTGIPPRAFQLLPRLARLNLSKNFLRHLGPDGFPALSSLDLSGNLLHGFDQGAFRRLGGQLDLSGNPLGPSSPLISSPFLRRLSLSSTSLSSLHPFFLSTLPSLSYLDLSHNSITDPSPLLPLPLPLSLRLTSNSWHCDCSDSKFVSLASSPLPSPPPLCSSPDNVTRLPWPSACLSVSRPRRSPPPWPLLVASIAVVTALTLLIACLRRKCCHPSQRNPQSIVVERGEEEEPRGERREEEPRGERRDEEGLPPPSYEEALLLPRLKADAQTSPGPPSRRLLFNSALQLPIALAQHNLLNKKSSSSSI